MKILFKHHTAVDLKDMAQYLEALSQGFAKGELVLSENEKTLALHPNGLISLTIKAKRQDGQGRLTIDFAWPE
ncbi:MAG: amphi-Trp domain-containing protein [Candidatus Adiutrix sp.]